MASPFTPLPAMETRIFATAPGPGPKGALLIEMLHLLRFAQQSSLSIALFIAVYFMYWHITLVDSIPLALIALSITIAATLILAQIATLAHTLFPTSCTILPLKNTVTSSVLLSIGYASVWSVVRGGGDDWFKPIRENENYSQLKPAGVEEHHAVLGRCLLVLGGVGLTVTLFISALAIRVPLKAGKYKFSLSTARRGGGYVAVGEQGYEFDEEETVCADNGSIKSL